MSLSIGTLSIELPVGLGARRTAVLSHLRSELAGMHWPRGSWHALEVPELSIALDQSNVGIARAIAQQLHDAAVARNRASDGGGS